MLNPFDLPGPEFLAVYVILFVFALGLAIWLRYLLRYPAAEPDPAIELSPWEIAYLAGGAKRASCAIVASLVHAGIIELDGKSVRKASGKLESDDPFEVGSIKAMEPYQEMKTVLLLQKVESRACKICDRLTSAGLLLTLGQQFSATLIPAMVMFSLPVIGFIKILVGVSRHRPVEILIFLCVMSLFPVAIFLAVPTYRSRAGDRLLDRLKRARSSLSTAVKREPSDLPRAEIATAVALFDIDVLNGGPYAPMARSLFTAWLPDGVVHPGGAGDGGCGAGGCGAGGCGGGCGGCGGCGGG